MDHRFGSRRADMENARFGVALASDILTILAMSDSDYANLSRRREGDIADEDVRDAVQRRVTRLGYLVSDLDALVNSSEKDSEKNNNKRKKETKSNMSDVWDAFVCGNRTQDQSEFIAFLNTRKREFEDTYAATRVFEEDSGSSSLSDYSDSRTDTSDGEGEEEEDDEGEDVQSS